MQRTTIGWCTHTVNPIRARQLSTGKRGHYCEKISKGCTHCYSSGMQPRLFGMPEFQTQRADTTIEVFLYLPALDAVRRRRKPARIFWCDMSDLFGAWVQEDWIAQCFAVMAATPHHTHLILTKRPERMQAWVAAHYPTPLPHVWLGTSVEDQQAADTRIPWLLKTPAGVRFLSVEPLLGPVRLDRLGPWKEPGVACLREVYPLAGLMAIPDSDWDVGRIGWVIVGGESGRIRRPMDLPWLTTVAADCDAARVPLYVKQDGALRPGQQGRIPDALWHRKEFPLPV
jgi:protein gp37